MNYRWALAQPAPLLSRDLANALRLPQSVAQCLVNRGLADPAAAAAFLDPRLKSLADPFAVPGMEAAVTRLFEAGGRAEPILIFGDYDVDGVSSTALLMEAFSALGWNAHAYLPHRFDEGYGLTREGVESALKRFPARLLLAVDCGSTAVETIAWLRAQGIAVLVLDHHQVSEPPPQADALVNPRAALAPGADGPFTELCSAGLAFKLIHALIKRGRERDHPVAQSFDLKPLLDLVALATLADLVPLTGENRILVNAGLARLAGTTRPGLVALKEVAGIEAGPVTNQHVSFQLAPRLNAAGRLETAEEALHLLLARSSGEAMPIAQSLDARNRERQTIERNIADQVAAGIRQRFDPARDLAIVEGEMLWHIGVVGIVASRVQREFHRPAIIFGGDGHLWRGSGRSIEGFDLAAALRECDDLLARHGGHAMAAGLSIEPSRVDEFRARLNALVRARLTDEELKPRLVLDAEFAPEELTFDLVEAIERLQPFGQGNPEVRLMLRNLEASAPPRFMGKEQQHARIEARGGGVTLDILWWRCERGRIPSDRFDLACVPEVNEYNGRRSLRLRLLDWRPA